MNGETKAMWMCAVAVLSAVCAGAAIAGGVRDSKTTFARDALAPYVKTGELPGAISVLCRDGEQETCCIGYADVAAKRKMRMDTLFMQCSQTKGFCGVTVAKLVEEGRIGLDDPVSRYLPEFATLWVEVASSNAETRTFVKAKTPLTIRMCMNHTGGFPFEISAKRSDVKGGGWSGGAPIRQAASVAAASPLLFEPGTKVRYSNTGIDIGAAVVETVTKMKWEDYLRKTVLAPLGMKDTCFRPTDAQLARKAELYVCVSNAPAVHRPDDGWQQRPFNDSHVFASAGACPWDAPMKKAVESFFAASVDDSGVRAYTNRVR